MLIEVIVCSVDDAVEAERGGAGRVEIVRNLERGGLTPPLDLVRRILDRVSIPARVMIRDDDGYEVGDGLAVARLASAAGACADAGVDGVVIGILKDGRIDTGAMAAVLDEATPARATFHHAFDALPDPRVAIDALARMPPIDRVLTSGGAGAWPAKARRLADLARSSRGITVLAGGGVDAAAVRLLARAGVAEAHAGRAAREPQTASGSVSAARVAALVDAAQGVMADG